MNNRTVLYHLWQKYKELEDLKSKAPFASELFDWVRDCEIILRRSFGEGSRQLDQFKQIPYPMSARLVADDGSQHFRDSYSRLINHAKSVFRGIIFEVETFGLEGSMSPVPINSTALEFITDLCKRFHLVARQISLRHNRRSTIEINDEYDVQDLFHALLRLRFNDVRDEEWTPSYGGGCSRIDFLLREEEIVVEIKKTRPTLSSKDLGEQLIIDIYRYSVHPNCKTLVCFVFDPDGLLKNPSGLENDLSKQHNQLEVIVMIGPK